MIDLAPNDLILTLAQVVPAISGGPSYESGPDGAKLVYGQPQAEVVPPDEAFVVRLPICNPLDHTVTLTNGAVETWHLDQTAIQISS